MRVVVLVGLPGSGKSTWAERQPGGILSSDFLRRLLADDEEDQTIHREVFSTLRYLLRRRLELRRPITYVDATNLTPTERRGYIKLAHLHGGRPEAVFFDVPTSICQDRNRLRARRVPEEILERFATRLIPPTLAEGFESVLVYAPAVQTRV